MPRGKRPHGILASQAEAVAPSCRDKFSRGRGGISLTHARRWRKTTFLLRLRAKHHKTFLAATHFSFRGPQLRSCWPLCRTALSSVDTRLATPLQKARWITEDM